MINFLVFEMDKLIYFISLSVYFVTILGLLKISSKENFLSPLNLFVIAQFLVIFFQFLGLFSEKFFIESTASYFRSYIESVDYYLLSLNALLYSLFNIFVFIFLSILKYTPIRAEGIFVEASLKDVFFFLFVIMWGTLFPVILFGPQKIFSPVGILEFRYFFISHGYIVLLINISTLFLVSALFFSILKFKSNPFFTLFLLVLFLFFGFISGARGFIIFNLLLILFLKYINLTIAGEISRLFNTLRINRKVFLAMIVITFIFMFYYFYSTSIRRYEGSFLSVLSQRFDHYVASYIALKENQIVSIF